MPKKNPIIEAQLAPLKAQLEAERAAIHATVAPLVAKREALLAQIQPLEAELRAVNQAIKQAEAPLHDIGNALASIARSIGATSLTLEAGETKAEPGEVG